MPPKRKRIDADTYIEEVLEARPEAVTYLLDNGIRCIRCGALVWDTLGGLLERHGIKGKKLQRVIEYIDGM